MNGGNILVTACSNAAVFVISCVSTVVGFFLMSKLFEQKPVPDLGKHSSGSIPKCSKRDVIDKIHLGRQEGNNCWAHAVASAVEKHKRQINPELKNITLNIDTEYINKLKTDLGMEENPSTGERLKLEQAFGAIPWEAQQGWDAMNRWAEEIQGYTLTSYCKEGKDNKNWRVVKDREGFMKVFSKEVVQNNKTACLLVGHHWISILGIDETTKEVLIYDSLACEGERLKRISMKEVRERLCFADNLLIAEPLLNSLRK